MDKDNIVERKKAISFYWIVTPQTTEDIDLALRQMRYIVNEDSLDKYFDAELPEQKRFFNSFFSNPKVLL